MTDYVVGFLREALSDRVLMVRKSKPVWQAGLLNGVGGKVDHRVPLIAKPDPGLAGKQMAKQAGDRLETPIEAMVREFKEETGITTKPDEWRLILYMRDPRDFYAEDGGTVYWFAATRRFLPKVPARVLDSGEELTTIRVSEAITRPDVLATVRWTIPMAFLDPTLAPLGSDDDVLANVRAAASYPQRLDVRSFVAGRTDAFRNGAASPKTTPPPGGHTDEVWKAYVMGQLIERRRMDIEAKAKAKAKPRDGGEWLPVGCKLKFVHRDGAPLCMCADVCMGDGMSPDNLEHALGTPNVPYRVNGTEQRKRPMPAVHHCFDIKQPVPTQIPVRALIVGDRVVNKAGTEAGKIMALDGPVAWVQSDKYPGKRITLYVADLYAAGGLVHAPRPATNHGEQLVNMVNAYAGDAGTVRGVVQVNGEAREHNGKALLRGVNTADQSVGSAGCPNGARPWRGGAVVPGEPLERPDAAWVAGNPGERIVIDDPDGAGAQEHFGGLAVSGGLPPMQEQHRP